VFDVWDINAAALDLFLKVHSQWRVLTVGGFSGGRIFWQGLDYSAVDVVMRRLDLDNSLFGDLLVMEGGALEAFGEVAA
jgi:hypothetical protein